MDLERLRAFRTVVAERSFSRAAEKLYRTQPAVSQAIGSLERELGEQLLVRRRRTVEVTPAGRIVLDCSAKAFDALDETRRRLTALRGLEEGTLSIGTSDTTACYVLPSALRAYRRRYPGIEIVLSNRPSPMAVRQVVAGEVDLGVVTLPVERPDVTIEVLLVQEDVVICSPRHPLAGRKRLRIQELGEHAILLLDKGSSTRRFIDDRLAQGSVVPRIAMELGSIEVIKHLVQLDFGISLVPRVAVRDEVRRGKLRAIRVFRQRDARRVGVVTTKTGYVSPAAREFMKVLRTHLPRDRSAAAL